MKQEENFKNIRKVLLVVLALNWAVAAAKVALGFFTNSSSIMADGFHSFSDGSSNIVGLVGIAMASRPKDRDHPYGHGKMENFAAIGIVVMLLLICFEILQGFARRLANPVHPDIRISSFAVMLATTYINYIVTRYEYRAGKRLKSDILIADSYHTRTDIYVSLAVMAGMIGVLLGYPFLDSVLSLFIAILIGRMAFDILRHTSEVLCDKAVINPGDIKKVVIGVKGVRGCHEVRTRGREDNIMMDLHVTVNESMRVGDAHNIADAIERTIKSRFAGVTEVIVHVEPSNHERG